MFWRTPRGKPQYLPRTIQKKKLHFSIFRPWTLPYHEQNKALANHKFVHVEPIKNWSFFRGDRVCCFLLLFLYNVLLRAIKMLLFQVEVLYGRDKGKQGFVKDIIQERNWIIVRGLNTKLECIGKTETFPGLYCQMEQPLLVPSQVQLVDPSDL